MGSTLTLQLVTNLISRNTLAVQTLKQLGQATMAAASRMAGPHNGSLLRMAMAPITAQQPIASRQNLLRLTFSSHSAMLSKGQRGTVPTVIHEQALRVLPSVVVGWHLELTMLMLLGVL